MRQTQEQLAAWRDGYRQLAGKVVVFGPNQRNLTMVKTGRIIRPDEYGVVWQLTLDEDCIRLSDRQMQPGLFVFLGLEKIDESDHYHTLFHGLHPNYGPFLRWILQAETLEEAVL